MSKEGLLRTRRKVQEAVEAAEQEYRRQLLNKRIEVAEAGLKAYQRRQHAEAARNFHMYLKIVENWKGVGEGGLLPSLFDIKKDASELLLISGVYWDLVKLYDRTKSEKRSREFLHYLEKYVLFSRDLPHQALCAETLRKHLAIGNPRHREDFKNAYKMIATHKCFVATALCDVTAEETAPRLRVFRDERLMRSSAGRAFISVYYTVGPTLADGVDRLPLVARKAMGKALDAFAALVARTD